MEHFVKDNPVGGVTVRRYRDQDAETWDRLVAASRNGTFLHSRQFLSYHSERFQDMSLLIEDERGSIAGVFPAALDPVREDTVVSHPGLSYGGVVHKGALRGASMLEALQVISRVYKEIGLRRMRYKVVPYIYHVVPSADDLYALFRLGAVRYRCDLSATIDLDSRGKMSKGRFHDLSKGRKVGVSVAHGPQYLKPYWGVLEENLRTRHNARPVHTLEEITLLQSRFSEQIRCIVGILDDQVVAGVVLFHAPKVAHVQYSASTAAGNSVGALTMVMDYAVRTSADLGARYFDFGTSNEHEGQILNEGLFRFKTSFGAGGVVLEFYEVKL